MITVFFIPFTIAVLLLPAFSLWKEWRLAAVVKGPSVCSRCQYELTASALTRSRCPECGTPFIIGGISSPRVRLDAHLKHNSMPVANVILTLLIGIGAGYLTDGIMRTLNSRQPEWLPGLLGFIFMGIFLTASLLLTWWRRRSLRRWVDVLEQAWTGDATTNNPPQP